MYAFIHRGIRITVGPVVRHGRRYKTNRELKLKTKYRIERDFGARAKLDGNDDLIVVVRRLDGDFSALGNVFAASGMNDTKVGRG